MLVLYEEYPFSNFGIKDSDSLAKDIARAWILWPRILQVPGFFGQIHYQCGYIARVGFFGQRHCKVLDSLTKDIANAWILWLNTLPVWIYCKGWILWPNTLQVLGFFSQIYFLHIIRQV